MKEDCVNDELDNINHNNLNGQNKTGLDEEKGEVSTENKNEDMIHSDMNENKYETIWYTLDKVI